MTASRSLTGLIMMSRFYRLNTPLFVVIAGWLIVEPHPGLGRFAGCLVFALITGSLLMILNDLLDKKADERTNSGKPLVSGSVRSAHALASLLVLGASGVIVAAFTVNSSYGFVMTLALTGTALAAAFLYSAFKRSGWFGSLFAAIPVGVGGLLGYVLAGGRGLPAIAISVAIYGTVRGIANNLAAGLRDVDEDPKAGTFTVAVRLGASRALLLAVFMYGVLIAAILGLAIYNDELSVAVPLALLSAAILAATTRSAVRNFAEAGRGREQRWRDLGWHIQSKMIADSALVAAFSPIYGVITGLVMQAIWAGGTWYERWAKVDRARPLDTPIPSTSVRGPAPR